jgi:DNA-binding beta-propeller fold protein YncE
MNKRIEDVAVAGSKIAKVIFCAMVLAFFIFSSLASCVHAFACSYKYYVANESVDPLQVVANITLGKAPMSITVNDKTNRVYVGVLGGGKYEAGNTIMVIDGDTDNVIAEIPLNLTGYHPDLEPYVVVLAVNPQTNRVYAALSGEEQVVVIDGATNRKMGEIGLRHGSAISSPYELAVNPVTNLLYTCHSSMLQGQYDSVDVYSGENLSYVTSVNIPGSNTSLYTQRVRVTVNPDTNRVYATWSGRDTVYIIDGNTNEITKDVSLDTLENPFFSEKLMVNSYTNYVYVGDKVLNGETLEDVTSNYSGILRAIDPIHNFLYTTDYQTLHVLDGATHNVIDSLDLDWSLTNPIAVNPRTSKVYVVNSMGGNIVVVPEFPIWTPILLAFFVLAVGISASKRAKVNRRIKDY